MFSDTDFLSAMIKKHAEIEPFDRAQLQPCSYDLRLSPHFSVLEQYQIGTLDVKRDYKHYHRKVLMDEYVLQPGELVLASTVERVRIGHTLAGRVEGKSSLGRLGLTVHITAGFIDAGFEGHITLELLNTLQIPMKVYAFMPVAQLSLFRLDTSVHRAYNGKYQHQDKYPAVSQYWKNFETRTSSESGTAGSPNHSADGEVAVDSRGDAVQP